MKENKITVVILKYKVYVIIAFLVMLSFITTSFALFRQDIIGQNTYSMEVVDLIPSIESDDLVNNSITLGAGEVKEIVITLTNVDPIDAKFNLFYESNNSDILVEYNNNSGIPGSIIESGNSLSYTILIRNPGTSSDTITFGSNGGFTTNELEFPSDKKVINNIPGCDDLDIHDLGIPNSPELVGDMIPVIYNNDLSEWVKADINNNDNTWYNYDEQMWANVVTVTSANRASLVNSEVGTVIPINDINTFMVWIPRYSYTIGNAYGVQGCGGSTPSVETPGAFDIKFVSSDMTELGTASYTGSTPTGWFTNSAFCWGNSCDDTSTRENPENRELSGIWISKFEISNSGNDTPNSLPNKYSWRNLSVSSMFYSILNNMNSEVAINIYGLSSLTYNTHMMKNTEWGVVAYFSQSRYGKYGDIRYSNIDKIVSKNNCSLFITGISGDDVNSAQSSLSCTSNTYNTDVGVSASTSGTIYGIYDLSGGTTEHVMGNMHDSSNNFNSFLADFTNDIEYKYYNKYLYDTVSTSYTRAILGDATKEVAGFNNSYKYFPTPSLVWFARGGNQASSDASIFRFGANGGNADNILGFRFVLSP